MRAKLIGESSAGATVVQIYNNENDLVWSHQYFANGATDRGYIDGLCQVIDDMMACADYEQYEGCDYDDDGDIIDYDTDNYTGVMIEYDSDCKKWELGESPYMGQSEEIIKALILSGKLDGAEYNNDLDADSEIIVSIVNYINL